MEVNSDENVRSNSLSFYRKAYNPELAVRYSLKNLSLEDGLAAVLGVPAVFIDNR